MDFIFRAAEAFLKKHKRLQRYRRVFAFLAAVVVFATTYELILPAITMDRRRAAETPGVEVGVAAETAAEDSVDAADGAAEADPEEENGQPAQEAAEVEPAQEAEEPAAGNDSAEDKESAEKSGDSSNSGEKQKENQMEEQSETESGDSLNGSSQGSGEDADDPDDDTGVSSPAKAAAAETAEEGDDAYAASGSENESSGNGGTQKEDGGQGTGTAPDEASDAAAQAETAAAAATAVLPEDADIVYPATLVFESADKSYTVTATFDESAALPAGTRLEAMEILPDMVYEDENGDQMYPGYNTYFGKTVETMDKKGYLEENNISDARFFDITFLDADGAVVEPAALVTIAVKYRETPSAEDVVDTVAVHFDERKDTETGNRENSTELTDTKTKIIAAETEVKKDKDGNEKIEEIAFDADAFSVYAIVTTKPGTPVNMTVGSTETITPDYPNGVTDAKYQSYTWTFGDTFVASIQSGKNDSSAVIKANKAGTATLTLDYKYGKKSNNATSGKAVFAVTVTEADDPGPGSGDDPAPVFTDEEATAQEGTLTDPASGGMTVTVKETGRLKKLSDYHVVVEDASDAYADDADMLKAYHIYLADQSGEEVTDLEKDLKNSQNLKLGVTITYDEEQDWFDQAKDIKHYKNGEEQTINGITFGKDKKTISFNVKGFSEFVIVSGPVSGGTSTPNGEALDLSDYLATSAENNWQTIDYPYEGNTQSHKKHVAQQDDDADVYIQKNVVPTDVEDEFYVYLSMDKQMSLGELFEGARFALSTNNNRPYGSVYDSLQGSPTLVYDEYDASNAYIAYETIINVYDRVTYSGKTQNLGNLLYSYTTTKYGVTPNCSNGSVYVEIPYSGSRQHGSNKFPSPDGYAWLTLASGVSLGVEHDDHNGDYLVFNIGLDGNSVLQRFSEVYTVLDKVTDTMSDQVEFGGVVACDGTYSFENGILTWNPVENRYVKEKQTVSSGSHNWYLNIAQMVYKVRLKTNEAGFESATELPVNNSAILDYRTAKTVSTTDDGNTYTFSDTTDYNGEFHVPTVQGQLYYILLEKADKNTGEKLKDAEFSLTGATGAGNDITMLPGTRTLTGITNSDGNLLLGPVPWGTYLLAETAAPDGYKISYSVETLHIGRTGDCTESGVIWTANEFAYNSKRYWGVDKTGNNNIKDIPITVKLNLSKKGADGVDIENAPFTVTATSTVEGSEEPPLDITLGTYTLILKNGYTYTLTEGNPPDGYQAVNPITLSYRYDSSSEKVYLSGASNEEIELTDSDDDGVYTYDLVIIDPLNSIPVKIIKIGDADKNNPLQGADFTVSGPAGFVTKTWTSDSSGILFEGTLEAGNYTLTETNSPAGYNSLSNPVAITINPSTDKPVSSMQTDYHGGEIQYPLIDAETQTYIIYINNNPGAELPRTGGTGFISPQTLCGIMAMAFVLATALMYGFRERRGERRYH